MNRNRISSFALVAFGIWASSFNAAGAEFSTIVPTSVGQRIYRDGILASGEQMTGLAQAGVSRVGKDAACMACHRRSGFGTSEGAYVIRPIIGVDLYQTRLVTAPNQRIAHQLGKPVRPPYDGDSLARAIRGGIDVTGHQLQNGMPRYALSDVDMEALLSYLKTLFANQSPGVTSEEIHLATVIQPGVSETKRRAMLDVLEAFVRDKNAGVRSEEMRRKAGAMRMHRAYRKWVLHVWELDGTQESWGAQLEARYHRQPVFAMVSGLGEGNWQPIHEFSERFGVPCILPMTHQPVVGGSNFYTIYFSRGISLEADALAKFFGDRHNEQKIIQVYRRTGAGAVAAAEFRVALPNARERIEDQILTGAPTMDFWRALASKPSTAIVLWLDPHDLADGGLPMVMDSANSPTVYLSATLLDGRMVVPSGNRILLTYPWELPTAREPLVLRTKQWLRSRQIGSDEEEVQINAHFAIAVAGDALAHMMDSFSREYFVERVEHGVTTTLMPSFFPRVSLGPDQRFASKGVYIVRPDITPNRDFVAVSELIVP